MEEEPEKLFESFNHDGWHNKEEIVKDIKDKLRELGYSTKDDTDPNIMNVICEHGKVCRVILLYDDKTDEDPWSFDIEDYDSIPDRCQICREAKTIEYMFDGDALKFWDETDSLGKFDEIDLNDFIDWDEVSQMGLKKLKEKFPKNTIFIDVDE